VGIPVRARNALLRNGVEIMPGTVFEMPSREAADHLIQLGVVTPYLDQPIAATPEYEVTDTGAKREIAPDAPPESFLEEGPDSSTVEGRKRKRP